MAPVTRTRSKALDKAEQATNTTDIEAGATNRGDKKDESLSEPSSPNTERKNLAMRTRDENEIETGDGDGDGDRARNEAQLLSAKSKKKRPRSSSVADSQDDDADAAPEPEPRSASKQLEEEASQRLASLSAEPELGPSPHQKPEEGKEGKSKHVVFGDDDDVDKYVAAAAETSKRAAPEAEEEEDSDEAPEAVSTKVAAKTTLESARALADATEKQATLLKRKRKERDNLFKEQAQKRKRVSKPEAGPEVDGEATAAAAAGRRRAEKVKLPSMLPAEYLADSSSESDEGDEADEAALRRRVVKRPNKKTNFEDKAPRDQVVGSTVYRVVASQGDKKLAPKMHKHARNAKEDLLRRKRAPVTPNTRKGFFARK